MSDKPKDVKGDFSRIVVAIWMGLVGLLIYAVIWFLGEMRITHFLWPEATAQIVTLDSRMREFSSRRRGRTRYSSRLVQRVSYHFYVGEILYEGNDEQYIPTATEDIAQNGKALRVRYYPKNPEVSEIVQTWSVGMAVFAVVVVVLGMGLCALELFLLYQLIMVGFLNRPTHFWNGQNHC